MYNKPFKIIDKCKSETEAFTGKKKVMLLKWLLACQLQHCVL